MTIENESVAAETQKAEMSPGLKFLLELGPLFIFFAFNFRGEQIAEFLPFMKIFGEPIFMATAAFMMAMTASLVASYALTRTVPIMPLVSGVVVLVFGGLTLWLHNDTFIKMKPTIVNVLFGSVLLGGLYFGKSLLAYVFESAFKINAEGWKILTLRWALFFLFLAVLNEIVWRNFSTDFWVAFKVWGVMPLTMAFGICQLPIMSKYPLEEEASKES